MMTKKSLPLIFISSTFFLQTAIAATVTVNINNTTSFTNQDDTASGSVIVSGGGTTLELTGNRWRATTNTYNISANTVLEFEFSSNAQGEIHGLGLDENNTTSSNRIFKLYGTQNWGISGVASYTKPGEYQSFSVPVGQYYTSNNMRVIFVNDQDSGIQNNNGYFRDVRLVTPDVPPTPPPVGCNLDANQQALLDAHNSARSQARNCGSRAYEATTPLVWNCTLGNVATAHSDDMADNNFFSHTGSDGLSPFDRILNAGYQYSSASENIAAGYSSVVEVMNAWLNSPGHCRNIMNPSFTELGAGRADNPNSTYRIYWTTLIAEPH
jgi:uncharacterized protein YkwD